MTKIAGSGSTPKYHGSATLVQRHSTVIWSLVRTQDEGDFQSAGVMETNGKKLAFYFESGRKQTYISYRKHGFSKSFATMVVSSFPTVLLYMSKILLLKYLLSSKGRA